MDEGSWRGLVTSRAQVLAAVGTLQLAASLACASLPNSSVPSSLAPISPPDREAVVPADAVKMTPATDEHPPIVYSDEYEQPAPLPDPINTAGAEDSPFITPDGNTLYFFFTPDVEVPVERQVADGVTGIYVSHRVDGAWRLPARVALEDPGMSASDGCEFVQGGIMWFCSVREGYTGLHWFTAEIKNGVWQNWKIADFNPEFKVGELHISRDGTELYFGSDRPGGKGGLDIWVSRWVAGAWQEPVNAAALNTTDDEGWPALNPAGDELWFTRNYGIWRSHEGNGVWQEPELLVSPLAGEPSIDGEGNLYFVHHFFTGDTMIEADIYVAYKR